MQFANCTCGNEFQQGDTWQSDSALLCHLRCKSCGMEALFYMCSTGWNVLVASNVKAEREAICDYLENRFATAMTAHDAKLNRDFDAKLDELKLKFIATLPQAEISAVQQREYELEWQRLAEQLQASYTHPPELVLPVLAEFPNCHAMYVKLNDDIWHQLDLNVQQQAKLVDAEAEMLVDMYKRFGEELQLEYTTVDSPYAHWKKQWIHWTIRGVDFWIGARLRTWELRIEVPRKPVGELKKLHEKLKQQGKQVFIDSEAFYERERYENRTLFQLVTADSAELIKIARAGIAFAQR